jgi:hypothetical protein
MVENRWQDHQALILLVPEAGVEPACPCGREILSLA